MALLAPADGDPQDSLLNRLYNLLDYFRESCIYQKIVVVCQDSNSDLNKLCLAKLIISLILMAHTSYTAHIYPLPPNIPRFE